VSIGHPDDPVWQGIVEMEEVQKGAKRKAIESSEPYRDPYKGSLPAP
jgi:hypothetical protein